MIKQEEQGKPDELTAAVNALPTVNANPVRKLLWIYRSIALIMVALLSWKTISFTYDATRKYQNPRIVIREAVAFEMSEGAEVPFNEKVPAHQLDSYSDIFAEIEKGQERELPLEYLGWSLYNWNSSLGSWELLVEQRKLSFFWIYTGNAVDSPYYFIECSVRPGRFAGREFITPDEFDRAFQADASLAESAAFLLILPQKDKKSEQDNQATVKANSPTLPNAATPEDSAPLPQEERSAPDSEALEPMEVPAQPMAEAPKAPINDSETEGGLSLPEEVDLRTSISGTGNVPERTTVGNSSSAKVGGSDKTTSGESTSIPPRKSVMDELSPLSEFKGVLPEMEISVIYGDGLSPNDVATILKKYRMAFYAPTQAGFIGLDGAWTCYSFADRKTYTEDGNEIAVISKEFGNILWDPSSSTNTILSSVVSDRLPIDFGGDYENGLIMLGSALLTANEAIEGFAGGNAHRYTSPVYSVQLRLVAGGVVTAEVKEVRESR
jgi:hypothetical protein